MKKFFFGIKIRVSCACRCLFRKTFFLMVWKKDGEDVLFDLTHKGADLTEVLHRIRVDAVEMIQDRLDEQDQDWAIKQTKNILK